MSSCGKFGKENMNRRSNIGANNVTNREIDIITIDTIAIGLKYLFCSVTTFFVFLFFKQPYIEATMKPNVNNAVQLAIKSAKLYRFSIPAPYPAPAYPPGI
jgi:hypothetical protein